MVYREKNGRFASLKKYAEHCFSIFVIGFIGFAVLFSFGSHTKADVEKTTNIEALVADLAGKKLEEKIAEIKHDLVRRLSEDCEAKGSKEPEGLIIFDSNGEASVGALQFQLKTVQHYVALFEGKDITRKEAILIATDWEQSSQLAEKIIFEEVGGIFNWENCEKKLGLAPEIEIIRRLEK